jgi:hypothetical protein
VLRDSAVAWLHRESDARLSRLSDWHYRFRFACETEDWDGLVRIVQGSLDDPKFTLSNGTLNNAAFALYKKCDNLKHLEWAIELMEDVIDEDEEWAFIDTYAALLNKTGKYREAEKQALRAIEIGKAAGEDMKSTKELLKEIRASR